MAEEETTYTVQRVLNILGSSATRGAVLSAEEAGSIPTAQRKATGTGKIQVRRWRRSDLPAFGAQFGFLKPLNGPLAVTVFTAKGGVLKTTLALNLARLAALHNLRVCVLGLDLQADITTALDLTPYVDDCESLEEAIQILGETQGLGEIYHQQLAVEDVLVDTDLPTLKAIPETPELAEIEDLLGKEIRREMWLKENVVDQLKKSFDLVVMDCSPNWNLLVTNALAASDVVLCPLECKVHSYRNLTMLRGLLDKLQRALRCDFKQIFVPTLLSPTRKLSNHIRVHYSTNVPGCTVGYIRENVKGEEAQCERLSLPEYAPTSLVADEMRELIFEIWQRFGEAQKAGAERAA